MAKFNPMEHMMDLKGKKYLQVMWRLVWFREEHPDWDIETQMLEHFEDSAVFTAKIRDANGRQVSSGHGSESRRDFPDFIEKAETKAVGRALAMLGYGTQFAPDLDEGERIVDSPVQRGSVAGSRKPTAVNAASLCVCDECGSTIVPFAGKDNKLITPEAWSAYSYKNTSKVLCPDCYKKAKGGEQ